MHQEPTPENSPVQNPNNELPPLPNEWPGAFGMYKYSKRAISFVVGPYALLLIVQLVLGLGLGLGLHRAHSGNIIAYLLDGLFLSAFVFLIMSGVREHKLSLGKAVDESMAYWLKMIGLRILLILSYIVSFILLIIPFFFVYPRLALASYYLVDQDMGILEAYKASWHATEGHALKIWSITGVNILIGVLVITIIGIPFAIYFYVMYGASFGVLYEMINKSIL